MVRYILGGFMAILVVLYYVILYFTVFDTTEADEAYIHK